MRLPSPTALLQAAGLFWEAAGQQEGKQQPLAHLLLLHLSAWGQQFTLLLLPPQLLEEEEEETSAYQALLLALQGAAKKACSLNELSEWCACCCRGDGPWSALVVTSSIRRVSDRL